MGVTGHEVSPFHPQHRTHSTHINKGNERYLKSLMMKIHRVYASIIFSCEFWGQGSTAHESEVSKMMIMMIIPPRQIKEDHVPASQMTH